MEAYGVDSLYLLPVGLIAIWLVSKLVSGTFRLVLFLVIGAGVFLFMRDSVVMYYLQWLPWK